MEYVIYTDESVSGGAFYSNFYGGALVRSPDLHGVRQELRRAKEAHNLFSELKWSKVTAQYLDRYEAVVNAFFDLVADDRVKLRVMFTQNVFVPRDLEPRQRENAYFLLYYQFLKHAFGLQHSEPVEDEVRLRINLDQMPGEKEAKARFRAYVCGLERSPDFRRLGIRIPSDQVAEVESHRHDVLQCLDVVLGAMQFRLNDKHKTKPPGARYRGRRTIAKEKLYRLIRKRIVALHPRFNVGITTGIRGDRRNRWRDPYRHWLFKPAKSTYDAKRSKRKVREG
jgi:hypothetical protein